LIERVQTERRAIDVRALIFFLNKGRELSTLIALLIDIVQIQSLFLTETICELLQIQGKKRCYE
jgi:hypothetical protein